MKKIIQPATWLILLMAGLPQFSETVYTPSLPDVAYSFLVSESVAEYTLTIYLLGMAIGTLFWGNFSDKHGRKPCILAGFFIFILGCLGCYYAQSMTVFMISRLIQGFGGSVGSVLTQAVSRDAFHGPALGKIYSSVGSALSIFPAIGPVLGGLIAGQWGWPSVFLFLIACGVGLNFLIHQRLQETHPIANRKPISLKSVGLRLLKDKKVLGLGLIVGAAQGIPFSYFSEAPFYLTKVLDLSPQYYGLSFILIALSTMCGGIVSRKLLGRYASQKVLNIGLMVIVGATTFFSLCVLCHSVFHLIPDTGMIAITIAAQMITMFGICMATSNALALALVDYKDCIGTASSFFGCFYYGVVSFFTFGMGFLHNGTLLPMPFYFLGLSLFCLLVRGWMSRENV